MWKLWINRDVRGRRRENRLSRLWIREAGAGDGPVHPLGKNPAGVSGQAARRTAGVRRRAGESGFRAAEGRFCGKFPPEKEFAQGLSSTNQQPVETRVWISGKPREN